jgi:hypothetical protein
LTSTGIYILGITTAGQEANIAFSKKEPTTKSKDITSNFKIDEIESQRISYFPPTHDKPTPTTISETSVCHDYVSTFKSGYVKGTEHSS